VIRDSAASIASRTGDSRRIWPLRFTEPGFAVLSGGRCARWADLAWWCPRTPPGLVRTPQGSAPVEEPGTPERRSRRRWRSPCCWRTRA